jgi:hypothetical protein
MLPLVNVVLAVCALLLSPGCSAREEVGGNPLVLQPGGEEGTKFSLTFEQVSLHREFPYYLSHGVELASEGKMYVKILAKVKNLGPREMRPGLRVELKVDTGNIYQIRRYALHTNYGSCTLFRGPEIVGLQTGQKVSLVDRFEMERQAVAKNKLEAFEPGKEGWIFVYAEIPAETRPIEIFGQVGWETGDPDSVGGQPALFRAKIPKSALGEISNPRSDVESAAHTPQEDEIRRAVEWAAEKYGQAQRKTYGPEWEYYEGCQKFVANAYGQPCPFHSYKTPAVGAEILNAQENTGQPPPKGSWVFYSVKSDSRGHVALSVGEGLVIHAYTVKTQQKATVRKDPFDNVPGATYIGWAWPQRKK